MQARDRKQQGDTSSRRDVGGDSFSGRSDQVRNGTERSTGPVPLHRLAADVDASVPMSVLVVDDSPSTRRLLRGVLENSEQFSVVGEAGDGRDAIDQAQLLQPDLVLLDLIMPTMSGTNALEEILLVSPRSIVVIVSGSDQVTSSLLTSDGVRGSIAKGIRPYDLLHQLCDLVGRPFHLDGPGGWDEMERMNRDSLSASPSPVPIRGRAIVFDPEPLVRKLIGSVLNSSGVIVIAETITRSILLTAVDLTKPEFVVLDLLSDGLPDMDMLSEVRRLSPLTIIIVYSKSADWRSSVLSAGATAFVAKPQIDELANSISHLSPIH